MNAIRKIIPIIDIEKEIPNEVIEQLKLTKSDFDSARKIVGPSALRELLIEVPEVPWDSVAGLDAVKEKLIKIFEGRITYPALFEKLKYKPPKGILLFGPPGTGKTLIVKAIASKRQINFISIKGPELLSKGVGDSEKHVREAFRKARQSAPCIIFFDEIDSLFPKRGSISDSTHVTESVMSQFLTELDGIEELRDVFVIGATNRPDLLDPALLRPGRFDKHLYILPPDLESRKAILKTYLRNIEELLDDDIQIEELAEKTQYYVGADLEALIGEVKVIVMDEIIQGLDAGEIDDPCLNTLKISKKHFTTALELMRGSLDSPDFEKYEQKSWDLLYAQAKREILFEAVNLINQVEYLNKKGFVDNEIITVSEMLKNQIYWQKKSFDEIQKSISELKRLLTNYVK